jgi:glycine/serine hydroxymethyltransferase
MTTSVRFNHAAALLAKVADADRRYAGLLHLNANENGMTPLAEKVASSRLNRRYCMSTDTEVVTFGRNAAFKAMPEVAEVVSVARDQLCTVLQAGSVDINCLSGVHAMMCALMATTDPGDAVMTVASNHGGHFATRRIIEMTGRRGLYAAFDYESLTFDVDEIAVTARAHDVAAIYLDSSVMLRPHPLRELRATVGDATTIIYDGSHAMGLILAGLFQNPLAEGADVLCGSTHKTFPGPRRGLVAFSDADRGAAAAEMIKLALVSDVHTAAMLSLCVAVIEYADYGADYAHQVVANANALGAALTARGAKVRRLPSGRYSENHQVHCFTDLDRRTAVNRCLANGVALSTSAALGDRLFLRIGIQEASFHGMNENDMDAVADILVASLRGGSALHRTKELVRRHARPAYGAWSECTG